MSLVDVVDEKDNVIGNVEYDRKKKSDILRCSVIFLFDKDRNILLQLRSEKDKTYPSCWDFSAGGHLNSGESYLDGARREMFEEIGMKTELDFVDKYLFDDSGKRKFFSSLFRGKFSGEFDIDPKEVLKVKFFPLGEIRQMIKNREKFRPECLFALKKYVL